MPAGLVRARVEVKNGKVQRVTVQNVPCFFYQTSEIEVPGLGTITAEIAFGGNNYAIVNAKDLKIGTTPDHIKNNLGLVAKVIQCINRQTSIQHPEKPHIKGVLALLINDEPSRPEAKVKNIYVNETGLIDRSPCGTGYVLDWDTFEEVVHAEANWLENPIAPANAAAQLRTHGLLVKRLFPMLPFNAFQVINEEACRRIEESKGKGVNQ